MRISDWSSDVCSSDLRRRQHLGQENLAAGRVFGVHHHAEAAVADDGGGGAGIGQGEDRSPCGDVFEQLAGNDAVRGRAGIDDEQQRSEEHTSELQSLMRISYAVFCLKKKNKQIISLLYITSVTDSHI